MKPTWGERLTWAAMNEHFNRLPFRGRLLFFLGGAFVGGGGLAGASLYLRSEEAARPPDDDDRLLRPLSLRPDLLSLSGAGKRWTGWGSSWKWPLPHWSPVVLELLEGILLVSPMEKTKRSAGTSATGAVRSNGRRSVAIPLDGTGFTEDSSTCRIKIETESGDVEHLQLNSEADLDEWSDALKRGENEEQTKGSADRGARRVVDVTYPRTWEAPFDNKMRLVKLSRSSEEYKRVAELAKTQQWREDFNSKSPYIKGRISVRRVWRVQEPKLWEAYCMRRAIIAAENDGDPNEKLLWHGTAATEIVLRKGLDPRVCSLNGLFGGGVYFADKSTKSVRYTGAYNRGDTGQLMLCRVSLGRQMVKRWPSQGLRRPPNPWPLYPSQLGPWWRDEHFHSLFAPPILMNEYIVYHSNQGVPEYVVDFKLV
ncbi:hypothetical protein ACHAWF_003465 [Thalassiosira exigua]